MDNRPVKLIKFQPKRTFGIELEFNECGPRSSGRRDPRSFLKSCVEEAGEPAERSDWAHNHNNPHWVCKTDSSCGYEIASRVLGSKTSVKQTLKDLNTMTKVVDVLKEREAVFSNNCGIHVHISVEDLSPTQRTSMLAYWVKCEKTIIDMMPGHRKSNTFCPTAHGFLRPNVAFSHEDLVSMGFNHRGALNVGHINSRNTVEFRLFEMTLDSHAVKNWVRFLLYFVETVKDLPMPENVNWYKLEDVLSSLRLYDTGDGDFHVVSPALVEMKLWLLKRVQSNAAFRDAKTIKKQVGEMAKELA